MKQIFDLTDEQITEIKELNTRKIAIQGLINDFTGSDTVLDKLLDRMTKAREAYDKWFVDMEPLLGVKTTPDNRWNVDFASKKLELL